MKTNIDSNTDISDADLAEVQGGKWGFIAKVGKKAWGSRNAVKKFARHVAVDAAGIVGYYKFFGNKKH